MTRINLVPVESLYDQHLMAEYRELPRVFGYVRELQKKGKRPGGLDIPKEFTFGNGHIKFFVNKLTFIEKRFKSLVSELKSRNFNIQFDNVDNMLEGLDPYWFNDYNPSEEEIKTSMARIQSRIDMRPGWYRRTKVE